MARKKSLDRDNDVYSLLLGIILDLSPNQAEAEYKYLRDKYTNRGRTKTYNSNGDIDKENGKVRLTPFQFRGLQTKYGDVYVRRAIAEMEEYIRFLELHQDVGKYRNKLNELLKRTHAKELDYGGWVYEKCKRFINASDTKININPFDINDISVARKYIENLSMEMRKMPDVQMLVLRFPELKELCEQE